MDISALVDYLAGWGKKLLAAIFHVKTWLEGLAA